MLARLGKHVVVEVVQNDLRDAAEEAVQHTHLLGVACVDHVKRPDLVVDIIGVQRVIRLKQQLEKLVLAAIGRAGGGDAVREC